MLTKVFVDDKLTNLHLLNINLINWIKYNKHYKGIICLDYRNRIRKNINVFVPFVFCNKIVFKYIDTFQQNNNILAKKIRLCVNKLIDTNITCIGGESYLYGLINSHINYNYYTNSEKLYIEAEHNKQNTSFLVNYNTTNSIYFYNYVIINLSKINNNLITLINKSHIKKLIIISCKHTDFWKKIKKLKTYKSLKRIKFININYFITVNIFIF